MTKQEAIIVSAYTGFLMCDFGDMHEYIEKKHEKVHRLIALAFVPNLYGLPEVNHKDENKHNNSASNLEWCTSGYNKTYGSGRKARSEGMKLVWKRRRAET